MTLIEIALVLQGKSFLFLPMIQNFTGHNQLRQRLMLATLSSSCIRIDDIRVGEDAPGLAGISSLLTARL